MRKTLILILSTFFLINFQVFAFLNKDFNWKKIKKDIYIDTKTITSQNETSSGWFKIFASKENDLYDIDGKKVEYEIMHLTAYCDTEGLEIKQIKSYDKNHNLLNDEINTHGIGCDYNGLANGEIYYYSLCKKRY